MEKTPVYGATASSGEVTTPSTSLGGMSGLVPPPPGISIWDPFQWKAPIPQQPATTLSYRPPAGRAEWLKAALGMRGLMPRVPQMAPAICQLPLLSWSRPATPYQQVVQPPSKTSGLGVTFDSSATKPAPTGSWDTDVCGRQATRGRDNDRQPASHPRGGREGSSIRKTNKLMPCQEGGRPAGAPRNIPPSSTSGAKKASPGDPLRNITNYRSAGWRKDLSHILRSFYRYNYPSRKEEEWNKLKTKFFNYLGQCQEEWKTIKEEKPLQYMPYMERQFQALTGVQLKGLSQFTGWIKPGSYYHGVVARKGQLHLCLHLAGTALPRGLQIHPSQTQTVMQKKEETPTTSHPMPGREGSVTQGACSNPPIPMETGGAGDGWSWAEQAEASAKEEWRRDRPAKHHRSSPRGWEAWSTNPFPLQDSEGRHEAVQQLYWHAGEHTPAHHDVVAQEMASHHPDLEPGTAKSLNNQVLCMISEYHLTCLSQGPSYVSPVLPEAAKNLLPSMEEYMAGGDFQGTQDLRVLERAKTLWVAVWLHCLDMAAAGDGAASYSLDAARHGRGPLLGFLLALQTSSLTFEEVIHWVLAENRYKVESSLDNVRELWALLQRELNDLSWAHKDEPEKSCHKKMKRDMEQRRRDLKGLEATISQYESSLGGAQVQPEGTPAHEDDLFDSEAEGAMATMPVADDAPAVSAAPESLTSPPGEEQTRSMEVDDGDDSQPPASPVSHREDELLTGGDAVGVEGEMANLTVSSPSGGDGGEEGASI